MLRMRLLITGGCGFIGSNFVRFVLEHYQPEFVTNVDVLTYAGNSDNLAGVPKHYGERYEFFQSDIADRDAMETIFAKHKFYAVVNFAAESHVDRSISEPSNFIHTNVAGTEVLLETARKHGVKRFIQISTDEVYGSLGPTGRFTETSTRVRRIRRARPPRICWRSRRTRRSGRRSLSLGVRITTGRINFRKS
jgi:dTDP-glucose 4,6-dehydratase